MRVKLIAAVLLLAAAGAALGAGRPSRGMPPHPRAEGGAIAAFAKQLEVRPGTTYRALTIYPVVVSNVSVPGVDLTLDEAVNEGLLDVDELRESEVNRLLVTNHAKEPVFVMGGEMLRGGKQDRIIADDLVIPAKSKLEVAVYCVEHGRWAVNEEEGRPRRGGRGGGGFTAGHSLAGPSVTAAGGMGGGGGQSSVWSKVAEQQRVLRAPSATGALRSVHDSAEVRKQMRPYQDAFADFLEDNPQASGLVAVVDGEVLSADVFSSRPVFRHMWPQLLEAYVIDTLERTGSHRRDRPPEQPAASLERWLRSMAAAKRIARDTPGEGTRYMLRGRDLTGSALVWQGGVVHAELFPARAARSSEEDAPRYNPQEFRRDRLRE